MPHAKPTPFSIGIIDWAYIRESLFGVLMLCIFPLNLRMKIKASYLGICFFLMSQSKLLGEG